MATATQRKLTVEEFLEITVEGDRKQLVAGEVVVNDPLLRHQYVVMRLSTALFTWMHAAPGRGLALPPIDVFIDEHNHYGPDLVWFSEARVPRPIAGRADRLPDLCVEVRSPGTWRYDVGTKRSRYEDTGLAELWMVDDASQSVLVFRRSAPAAPLFDVALEVEPDDCLTSPAMPALTVPVRDLFPPEEHTQAS